MWICVHAHQPCACVCVWIHSLRCMHMRKLLDVCIEESYTFTVCFSVEIVNAICDHWKIQCAVCCDDWLLSNSWLSGGSVYASNLLLTPLKQRLQHSMFSLCVCERMIRIDANVRANLLDEQCAHEQPRNLELLFQYLFFQHIWPKMMPCIDDDRCIHAHARTSTWLVSGSRSKSPLNCFLKHLITVAWIMAKERSTFVLSILGTRCLLRMYDMFFFMCLCI